MKRSWTSRSAIWIERLTLINGTSPDPPQTRVLLAVLAILFDLDQFQRLRSHFLVLHFIIQVPKSLLARLERTWAIAASRSKSPRRRDRAIVTNHAGSNHGKMQVIV